MHWALCDTEILVTDLVCIKTELRLSKRNLRLTLRISEAFHVFFLALWKLCNLFRTEWYVRYVHNAKCLRQQLAMKYVDRENHIGRFSLLCGCLDDLNRTQFFFQKWYIGTSHTNWKQNMKSHMRSKLPWSLSQPLCASWRLWLLKPLSEETLVRSVDYFCCSLSIFETYSGRCVSKLWHK